MIPLRRISSALLSLPLLAAGCASENPARDLAYRLDKNLSPGIARRQVVVEPLPEGAKITFPENALFPVVGGKLSPQGDYLIVSVVQSFLAPSIMQVQVDGNPSVPEYLRTEQVRSVQQFFPTGVTLMPPPAGRLGTSPGAFTMQVGVRPDWAQRLRAYPESSSE